MIETVYRDRQYTYADQWCSWFEPCPVVHETERFITVRSQTYETIAYPGGNFRLDKGNLLRSGKKYHSRHGEWFYLERPRQGDLFPSKELLETADFVLQEAAAIGWDITVPIREWAEWQKMAWLYAKLAKVPLRRSVDLWKSGGLGALELALRDHYGEQQLRMMAMVLAGRDEM
jgi:hypothetical protein